MKNIQYLFILLFLPMMGTSQTNFGKVWLNGGGYNYTTTFNSSNVVNKMICSTKFRYFAGGHSNICDSNGNLILCSDGYNLYDSNLNYIEDGDTLIPKLQYLDRDGWSEYPGGAFFFPFDSNKYYLVTPAMSDTHFTDYFINGTIDSISKGCYDMLLYHTIEMKANGGAGKVVKKAVELLTNIRSDRVRMTACKHANGKDWWLLKQATDTNMVYSFLFRQDTVEGPFIQGFSEPHFGKQRGWANNLGQSVFSLDGTKYASGAQECSKLVLSDFDRCTGKLSNPKVYNVPIDSAGTAYEDDKTLGLAFSSSGQFIYIIKFGFIWQLDLNDNDSNTAWFRIAQNLWELPNFQIMCTSYLAPDSQIYIGNRNGLGNNMSIIEKPNIKGIGCNFCPQCLVFSNIGVNSPPNMPNYDLGPLQPCWPLEVSGVSKEFPKLSCYPNPASTLLTIELDTTKNGIIPLEMYNMVGELILKTDIQSQTKVQINISSLPKGLYVIRCKGVSQKVVIE